MKVLVLGGSGAMAKGMVWDFVENEDVQDILLADINVDKAKEFAKAVDSPKISVQLLDATDHSQMVKTIRGFDIVANSAWYELNVPVMLACLEAKAHYADLGGLYHETKKQLELDDKFKKAGLTAILGIGASPGLVNLCVGNAISKLDQIDDIHIRTGAVGGKGFAYSAKTVIDELTMLPAVYKDGEMHYVEPLTGREKYSLPDPVGEVEGFYSIHSELATLPYLSDTVKNVTFRVAFSTKMMEFVDNLVSLKLLSDDPVEIKGVKISAKEFLYKYLSVQPEPEFVEEFKSFRVNVKGKTNNMPKEYVYETMVSSNTKRKLRATAIWTGVPLAVAADLLCKGVIDKHGVIAPEELPVEPFIKELEKRNIVINEYEV